MSEQGPDSGALHDLFAIGNRAAAAAIRPFSEALGAAAELAAERMHGRAELERLVGVAIDEFFDSGLFDRFVDRLLASDALWRLVDEIAQSPSVAAAISGQGLGFADQFGEELRTRSRRADAWLEQAARRAAHRRPRTEPGEARDEHPQRA